MKNPQTLTREKALNCKPIKNSSVQEIRLEHGEIQLNYPISLRPWATALGRFFGRDPSTNMNRMRKLQLDELGASVWELMNGRHSVRQIAQLFAERHRLEIREAEVSVVRFLRELGRRGIIGMG